MITRVFKGQNYINVSVGVTNTEGGATDPTSAEAWFYKVSQVDGSLSLDTAINGSGKVTLQKQGGEIGFWGAPVDTSALNEAEYVILFKVLVGFTTAITVDGLSIYSRIVDYGAIADAVWDEVLSGHSIVGTTGEAMLVIRGLVQQNFLLDSTAYNAKGLLVAGRMRIFGNKADVLAATDGGVGEGEIAIFNVQVTNEAAPDEDKVKMYKVTREP
ncbi:MAG: hypothetical protein J7K40_13780 [candidate division Zixibacteria bacterium]|nr:hypothetical protein [candidate division Zixibacteria bacterium]